MRKRSKLELHRDTLRVLAGDAPRYVAGAGTENTCATNCGTCFATCSPFTCGGAGCGTETYNDTCIGCTNTCNCPTDTCETYCETCFEHTFGGCC